MEESDDDIDPERGLSPQGSPQDYPHKIEGYTATGHQPPMKRKATGPPATQEILGYPATDHQASGGLVACGGVTHLKPVSEQL
ncbi:unnamed protein product [Orchesella dallaii]|uniref:Uncharacterized protein n=1 Tax=Orchesella dallaii TaxID=48710 RepID=A0ABP1Q7A2_9HEXA